jgi:hypothetical protein
MWLELAFQRFTEPVEFVGVPPPRALASASTRRRLKLVRNATKEKAKRWAVGVEERKSEVVREELGRLRTRINVLRTLAETLEMELDE